MVPLVFPWGPYIFSLGWGFLSITKQTVSLPQVASAGSELQGPLDSHSLFQVLHQRPHTILHQGGVTTLVTSPSCRYSGVGSPGHVEWVLRLVTQRTEHVARHAQIGRLG